MVLRSRDTGVWANSSETWRAVDVVGLGYLAELVARSVVRVVDDWRRCRLGVGQARERVEQVQNQARLWVSAAYVNTRSGCAWPPLIESRTSEGRR